MSTESTTGARVPPETIEALEEAGVYCVERQLAAEEAAERERAWAESGDELAARRRGLWLLQAAIYEQRSYEVTSAIERLRGD